MQLIVGRSLTELWTLPGSKMLFADAHDQLVLKLCSTTVIVEYVLNMTASDDQVKHVCW